MTFFVLHFGWKYRLIPALLATGFFLAIDLVLFSANTLKIIHGGWFPLVLGAVVFTIMLTWKRGLVHVTAKLTENTIPLRQFIDSLLRSPPIRGEGTAIFIRRISDGVPHAMLHNLIHNKVVHHKNVILTVHHESIPRVPVDQRISMIDLGHDCYQVDVRYGFKDVADVPESLQNCNAAPLHLSPMETSYFVSRQIIDPFLGGDMFMWRKQIFATMYRNARDTAYYFRLPANRVIELGTQIEI